jgi:hypothetical protein
VQVETYSKNDFVQHDIINCVRIQDKTAFYIQCVCVNALSEKIMILIIVFPHNEYVVYVLLHCPLLHCICIILVQQLWIH